MAALSCVRLTIVYEHRLCSLEPQLSGPARSFRAVGYSRDAAVPFVARASLLGKRIVHDVEHHVLHDGGNRSHILHEPTKVPVVHLAFTAAEFERLRERRDAVLPG